MGQKVTPHGLRVGVIKNWDSRWFAKDEVFGDTLVSDYKLRKYLKEKLQGAGVPKIEIERDANRVKVFIHCAKPGVVIGRGGAEIDKLKLDIAGVLEMPAENVVVNVVEVKSPDLNAQLVAESIALQLEKRTSFRRAMKQAIGRTMRLGAKGIKVTCSVSAARKSRALSTTTRVPFRCRRCVRTSSTVSGKQTPPTARSASRSGSTAARCSPRSTVRHRRVTTDVRPAATIATDAITEAETDATTVRATAEEIRIRTEIRRKGATDNVDAEES